MSGDTNTVFWTPLRKGWIGLMLIAVFFVLNFTVELINGRLWMNDFMVYHSAAQNLLDGGNPYAEAFGLSSGFYKYSPAMLMFFIPSSQLVFETAKIAHFVVSALFGTACFYLIWNLLSNSIRPERFRKTSLFYLALLLTAAVHLTREMHLGNINLILIGLSLLYIQLIVEQKTVLSGMILAIILLLKPYFALLIFPALFSRQIKPLTAGFLFLLILAFLPFLFTGWEHGLELYSNWKDIMISHSSGGFSEHTFNTIIFSYTGVQVPDYFTLIFIGLTILIYTLIRLKNRPPVDQLRHSFILDSFVLMAIIPNLVITDSQHFLFSLPLIGYIIYQLNQRKSIGLIFVFMILIFFYGMNSNDLLGNPLSDAFDRFSTIGVANLLLIMMAIGLKIKTDQSGSGRNSHQEDQ